MSVEVRTQTADSPSHGSSRDGTYRHSRRELIAGGVAGVIALGCGSVLRPLGAAAATASLAERRRRAYEGLMDSIRDAGNPGVRGALRDWQPAEFPLEAGEAFYACVDALDEAASPSRFADLSPERRIALVRDQVGQVMTGNGADTGGRISSLLAAALQPAFPAARPHCLPWLV